MLHILWILLKLILILLGILLGLILLTILLVLFCPVRYCASASKETDFIRDIYAKARISWLFGAVSFKIQYVNMNTVFDFHLFGIPVMKLIQKFRTKKKSHTKSKSSGSGEPNFSQNTKFVSSSAEAEATPKSNISTAADSSDSLIERPDDTDDNENFELIKKKLSNFFYKLGNFCRSLHDRFSVLWRRLSKIPASVENFALTIQNICAKIDSYQKFLDHPRTRAALSLIKDKVFKLFKHVFPTRIQGKLTFGSTDPSITGAVLAVLGMTIPLHKNCIVITPLFEDKNVLQGNVDLKGRIYGIVLLKTAVELYFNKNIKYVIRRWKHK